MSYPAHRCGNESFLFCLLAFASTLLGVAQAHAAPAESQSSATTVNYQRQFGYLPLRTVCGSPM